MNCDICGGKGNLFKVEMEGSELTACDKCAVHGKKISKVVQEQPKFKEPKRKQEKEEPMIIVVENYNSLIKNKREKLGLKQEELAKSINEKESLIQQIENKKIEPNVDVAKKLERKLNIKLLDVYEQKIPVREIKDDKGPVTLGDLVKIKTRKKKQ